MHFAEGGEGSEARTSCLPLFISSDCHDVMIMMMLLLLSKYEILKARRHEGTKARRFCLSCDACYASRHGTVFTWSITSYYRFLRGWSRQLSIATVKRDKSGLVSWLAGCIADIVRAVYVSWKRALVAKKDNQLSHALFTCMVSVPGQRALVLTRKVKPCWISLVKLFLVWISDASNYA